MGDYTVVHFGGHGGFIEGHGYLGLNEPDGGPDWLDGEALARLASNYRSIKLMVLNACESGHADDGRAFSGSPRWSAAASRPSWPCSSRSRTRPRYVCARVLQAALRGR